MAGPTLGRVGAVVSSRDFFPYRRTRVDYLTHISERHRCVFVEVPKAGCSVVKRVLQYCEVDGEGYDPSASVHDRSISPLAAPLKGGFALDEVFGTPSRYYRFSFVRNPYTRALSCYLEKIAGEQWLREMRLPDLGFDPHAEVSFVEFLRAVAAQPPADMDIHWAPQHFLLSLPQVRYDFLGRFESFHADLRRMIDTVGLTVPESLLQQRTAHTTGAGGRLGEYYDAEALELVQQVYREDFTTLGYGWSLRTAG